MKSVLISGASIAGPTMAYWLKRNGFIPTLVERSPIPRPGGHAIDVRGVALDILQAMGILEAARNLRTTMKGVSRIDRDGNEVWRSEEMTITGGTLANDDIEILRDDLSNLLLSALPTDVEIIFDSSISVLLEDGDGVVAEFEDGSTRRFDLVIGADGIGSNVRRLAFGDPQPFLHPLGTSLAIFSAPNDLGIADWQLSYRDGERGAMVYTARNNTELRCSLGVNLTPENIPRQLSQQMDLVEEQCRDMAWEVPRLLKAMRTAEDFYLGPLAQVKMPAWTKGRIALVGDAAYCPSPYTGQGTSLALIGAYVLAYELGKCPEDFAAAFAGYETRMRPFVEINQAILELTRDERFADPEFYPQIEAAMDKAKFGIALEGLDIA